MMGQIGTVLAATSAVAFVSLGRAGSSTPGRRARLAGLVLASVLFLAHAVLAQSVASGAFPARADLPLLGWIVEHRTAPMTALFSWISAVGGTAGMAVLATVAAALLWLRHRRRAAVGTVVAAIGAELLMGAFKHLYGRSRPPLPLQLVPESSLSFPSGHALDSIVVIGMFAVLVGSELRSPRVRSLLAVLSVAAVALIGLSRLYLGVHWLSDVLAGWSLGGAWLALCVVITLPRRQRTRSSGVVPTAPDDHIPGATKERSP